MGQHSDTRKIHDHVGSVLGFCVILKLITSGRIEDVLSKKWATIVKCYDMAMCV